MPEMLTSFAQTFEANKLQTTIWAQKAKVDAFLIYIKKMHPLKMGFEFAIQAT
jgi:hypothetical protein